MTKEEVKLAMDTINTIEELEKKIGYIKTSSKIIFENLPMVGKDVYISDVNEIKELKDLVTMGMQTKIDEFKNQLRKLGIEVESEE